MTEFGQEAYLNVDEEVWKGNYLRIFIIIIINIIIIIINIISYSGSITRTIKQLLAVGGLQMDVYVSWKSGEVRDAVTRGREPDGTSM